MALIVGGLVGFGILIGTIIALVTGNGLLPFGTLVVMVIAIGAFFWAKKELKKLKQNNV